ncbi:hypothetical protein ACFX2J_007396 [Malus domestica]
MNVLIKSCFTNKSTGHPLIFLSSLNAPTPHKFLSLSLSLSCPHHSPSLPRSLRLLHTHTQQAENTEPSVSVSPSVSPSPSLPRSGLFVVRPICWVTSSPQSLSNLDLDLDPSLNLSILLLLPQSLELDPSPVLPPISSLQLRRAPSPPPPHLFSATPPSCLGPFYDLSTPRGT